MKKSLLIGGLVSIILLAGAFTWQSFAKEVSTTQPGGTSSFEKNLYFGMRNNSEVMNLQEFLTNQGYYTGPITGNYYILTLQGVRKFQSANGIFSSGFFGPKSRESANAILKKIVGDVCTNEQCETDTQTLAISTETKLRATVGQYFVATFRVTGGSGFYSIVPTGDVKGLVWTSAYCGPGMFCAQMASADTITLYGTPTAMGSYPISISAKELTISSTSSSLPRSGKAEFTLVVGDGTPEALTVTSPNGKESWKKGGTYFVTWKSNSPEAVTISVLHPVQCFRAPCNDEEIIVAENILNTGTYSWTIPSSLVSGSYRIKVATKAASDTSNDYFTINESSLSVSISSMTPTSGPAGTVITLTGSGFSAQNTVHFGYGIIPNVRSDRGSITFSVPDFLTPACYYSQPACLMPSMPIQPGTYDISVTSDNGTSNTVSFTVTR